MVTADRADGALDLGIWARSDRDANALPVRESDLDDFYARFEEPHDEGEELVHA